MGAAAKFNPELKRAGLIANEITALVRRRTQKPVALQQPPNLPKPTGPVRPIRKERKARRFEF
jgi:hypothetical protein